MDLHKITEQTIQVAKSAALFIRTESEQFRLDKVEFKGFNDLVSYVDKEAEKIIVEGLQQVLPEAGFITEEQTVAQHDAEWKWIVDPLDGTTNFVHGVPPFAVSIALSRNGQVVAGVVLEVTRNECFHAFLGGGAFCDGKPIKVSSASELGRSLVAIGFPYNLGEKFDGYFQLLRSLVKQTHGLRRLGSAAVDLCYVACGRVEAYVEYNLQTYDIAAGAIIVSEAGGKVSDFSGGDGFLSGKEILASNGKIHEDLLTEIRDTIR